MSVNCSFFRESFADPNVSNIYSSILFQMDCLRSKPSSVIYTTFSIIQICLLLPLSIFILYLGLQQWLQKCSTSSAAPMSHSDFFTYLVAIVELIDALGQMLRFIGIYNEEFIIFFFGIILDFFVWYGEMHLNVLTSIELYLAVVYPITYLRHRYKRGIKIRNITCGCLLLSSFVGLSLVVLGGAEAIYGSCLLTLAVITVSFCSLSVLCTLIRPRPGEQGKSNERIDQKKKRAFFTIVAILIVLLLKFAYSVIWLIIYSGTDAKYCLVLVFGFLFHVPSSLVLPLLFLHRAGTIICCRVSGVIKT